MTDLRPTLCQLRTSILEYCFLMYLRKSAERYMNDSGKGIETERERERERGGEE